MERTIMKSERNRLGTEVAGSSRGSHLKSMEQIRVIIIVNMVIGAFTIEKKFDRTATIAEVKVCKIMGFGVEFF